MNDNVKQFDAVNQVSKESEIKEKPEKANYKKAKNLLKNFGLPSDVYDNIPEFNTKLELQRYTKTIIDKHLSKYK